MAGLSFESPQTHINFQNPGPLPCEEIWVDDVEETLERVEKPQKGPLCPSVRIWIHRKRSEESNKFNMFQMHMHSYEFEILPPPKAGSE